MYICLCNGYRDAEICEAAQSGLRCARAVYATLGGEPRCGRCLGHAQALVDEVHGDRPAQAPAGMQLTSQAG